MSGGRRKRLGEEEYNRVVGAEAKESEMNQPKQTREEIFKQCEHLELRLRFATEDFVDMKNIVSDVLDLLKRNL